MHQIVFVSVMAVGLSPSPSNPLYLQLQLARLRGDSFHLQFSLGLWHIKGMEDHCRRWPIAESSVLFRQVMMHLMMICCGHFCVILSLYFSISDCFDFRSIAWVQDSNHFEQRWGKWRNKQCLCTDYLQYSNCELI